MAVANIAARRIKASGVRQPALRDSHFLLDCQPELRRGPDRQTARLFGHVASVMGTHLDRVP
jgi:hypothetical protein